jgi:hypothetical protein
MSVDGDAVIFAMVCHCRSLLPLKLERLRWHSCALVRDAIPRALGPRLSIDITIEVAPFIDVLAARLLLFLLEEFLFIVAYAVSP